MKLFKKLNEALETERIINEEVSDTEMADIEEKVVFEGFIENLEEIIEAGE